MTMTDTTQALPFLAPDAAATARRQRERWRRLRRLLKRGLLLALAGLLALVLVRALLPSPVAVELAPVAAGHMQVTVDESGRTRVKDRFVIAAPVSGRIARIALRPGDPVAAGDPVALVTPSLPPLLDGRTRAELESRVAAARFAQGQAQASVERAATALEQARRESERAQRLYAGGAVTAAAAEQTEFTHRARAEELASAQLGVKLAEEDLRRARALLTRPGAGPPARDSVEVRAPVAGQVLRVLQESEGFVQTGAPLLEVGDPNAIEVVVDVLTADAVGIRPGARVTIESWGGPAPLSGRVRRVEPSAFVRISALGVEEQRVNVLVDLDGSRDRWASLGDGFRVEARILVWESPDTLVLPSAAVVRSADGWAVYRVEAGKARLRAVTLGHRSARELEVLSGVERGDQVVLYPGDRLADGAAVKARGRTNAQ
jgi:HlyD family secretion protein